MTDEGLTPGQQTRYEALMKRAWLLMKDIIHLAGAKTTRPLGWFGKWNLQKAEKCLTKALQIQPNSWSALWLRGKIFQRRGEYTEALEQFRRAHELNPEQPDVVREAGLTAMDLGDAEAGVYFCERAVALKPDDSGLFANLALAQLFAGQRKKALASAQKAVQRNPDDGISRQVLTVIEEVRAGKRTAPKTLRDLE